MAFRFPQFSAVRSAHTARIRYTTQTPAVNLQPRACLVAAVASLAQRGVAVVGYAAMARWWIAGRTMSPSLPKVQLVACWFMSSGGPGGALTRTSVHGHARPTNEKQPVAHRPTDVCRCVISGLFGLLSVVGPLGGSGIGTCTISPTTMCSGTRSWRSPPSASKTSTASVSRARRTLWCRVFRSVAQSAAERRTASSDSARADENRRRGAPTAGCHGSRT